MEDSGENNTSPKLFKGKPILIPFLHQAGACVLATPKTHKDGKLIKLISRDPKTEEIRYYMLGSPRVKVQNLASKEQLLVPALSLSFNPITRESGSTRIPFTAGWIREWETFKSLLYEDHEFALFSVRSGLVSTSPEVELQFGEPIYAVFRRGFPPIKSI